jgi:phosphate:Na+ symporter
MDELYESKVKVLYAAIVEFISRSQSEIPSMYAEEMFRLRTAAAEIVENVKHVKHLRKNATRYLVSDNEHIRAEYNRLRYQIAMLLREIYRVREEEGYDHELAVRDLKTMKKEVRVKHGEMNEHISAVLRDEHITPIMATSLLNDFNYVDGTLKGLYDCAKALLSSHAELVADAAEEINLDDDTEMDEATAA